MVSALAMMLLAPIDIGSLLPEMTDLDRLTRPLPYTAAQASSYDRKSKSPTQDWFANADAGQYLRVEGREHVMADLAGPGAVVRIWSANPAGTIRFYFDGEATPRLEANMADLMTGKVEPFRDPFAYLSAQGTNLYFPFPYSKSLKITVEGDQARALYYHVGFRTYPTGTAVETFSQGALQKASRAILEAAVRLQSEGEDPRTLERAWGERRTLAPGSTWTLKPLTGRGTIREFEVSIPFPLVQTFREMDWSDPHQPHNVLRSLWLSIEADGARTVETPLGDFFASTLGNEVRSLPMRATPDGRFVCRFPMPFHRNLKVSIFNRGKVEVPVSVSGRVDRRTQPGPYLFHAQFGRERGRTRPFRDLAFLHATGAGNYVGSHLHVENPTGAWWGEGDEKFYVDGEPFASTFGTGTEDYYGYAWCSPQLFARAYHGQPRCDGPANFGHTSVFRWHVFDPIPFRTSLKFDMEMWHWAEVEASWNWTSYWYAKPGSAKPVERPALSALLPLDLQPKAVKGAIEGEAMTLVSKTGGQTSHQEGFWETSGGKQLWWVGPSMGDRLVLRGRVEQAGRYRIDANLCHAVDYGIHQLYLNGKPLGTPIDFYGQGVTWKLLELGVVELAAGEFTLEVECVGQNEKAIPRRMFGLDYLLPKKL